MDDMKLGRYGLPEKVLFCSRCVISNQRPSSTVEFLSSVEEEKRTIKFDSDGVCDACLYHDAKEGGIDWHEREQDLIQLSESVAHVKGYNVVVPGSGGKDSAYTAHILKYKYGFRPLTVTWAPHMYTEIGWKNFINWSHVGGLDNVLFTPNGQLHRYLTRQAFLNLLHPFQPFIVGQRIIGPAMARRYNIPLVFYGENQAEYGNDSAENSKPTMESKFFSNRNVMDIRLGGISIERILAETKFQLEDFAPYLPLSQTEGEKDVTVHYLGYYLKWDPQECYYYAAEHTGFSPSPIRTEGTYSTYSSIDDKVDPFHYFTTLAKFGLGRASYDAAQEIRNGKITREEGINLVRQFDLEFPNRFFPEFLDYVGISEEKFHSVVNSGRSPHIWEERGGEWILKHPVWEHG